MVNSRTRVENSALAIGFLSSDVIETRHGVTLRVVNQPAGKVKVKNTKRSIMEGSQLSNMTGEISKGFQHPSGGPNGRGRCNFATISALRERRVRMAT